jgi:hypothetical protein
LNLTDVGVYSNTFQVPHGRLLPVEIRIGNGPRFEDLVVLHNGDQRHAWLVTEDGRVQRSSSPVSQESMAIQEAMFLGGGALWILIVSLVIVLGRLEREGRAFEFRLPEPVWLLVWLGVDVAFGAIGQRVGGGASFRYTGHVVGHRCCQPPVGDGGQFDGVAFGR